MSGTSRRTTRSGNPDPSGGDANPPSSEDDSMFNIQETPSQTESTDDANPSQVRYSAFKQLQDDQNLLRERVTRLEDRFASEFSTFKDEMRELLMEFSNQKTTRKERRRSETSSRLRTSDANSKGERRKNSELRTQNSAGTSSTNPDVNEENRRQEATERLRASEAERLTRAGFNPQTGQPLDQVRSSNRTQVPRQWTPDANPGGRFTQEPTPVPIATLPMMDVHSSNNTKIVFDKPEKFDGSDSTELDSFLHGLEWYFKSNERMFELQSAQGHNFRIIAAQSRLAGTAKSWFIQMDRMQPQPRLLQHWPSFRQAMLDTFGNPLDEQKALRELHTLKQRGEYRDIQTYTLRFNELSRKAGLEGVGELFAYRQGLSPEIVDALASHPQTYDSLHDLQTASYSQWLRMEERNAEKHSRYSGDNQRSGRNHRSKYDGKRSTRKQTDRRSSQLEEPTRPYKREEREHRKDRKGNDISKTVTFERSHNRKSTVPSHIKCYECGGNHYAPDCPKRSSINFVDTTDAEPTTGVSDSKSTTTSEGSSDSESSSEYSDSGK